MEKNRFNTQIDRYTRKDKDLRMERKIYRQIDTAQGGKQKINKDIQIKNKLVFGGPP